MTTDGSIKWQFSGSEAAKKAAAASLGTYTSKLFAMCNAPGKSILPPKSESAESSHTAEKAVIKSVICGTGNAYASSIGLPVARSAVAKYLNGDNLPKELTADDVFMTVGCKQSIELAVDILTKPNANVLLPRPGYPVSVVRTIYKNLTVKYYDFLPQKNYKIDLEGSVRKLVDENTFAIFIINPHNPNGNIYTETHLKELAELARELKIMVVSDEVFRWTVFGSNPFISMGKFSSIVPVITLGSISKGWSVPGWRTGWLALHDPNGVFKTTKIFESAREFLEINSKPPTVIQAAIPTILEDTPEEFFERRQAFLREKVDHAFYLLERISRYLSCPMKPDACTFLWTELQLSHFKDIKTDDEFCEKLATEENLVVLPGIAFGLENWVRHSIDMEIETLNEAFERLKNFCDRHKREKLTSDEWRELRDNPTFG